MIHTGSPIKYNERVSKVLATLGESLEFYLPDEKISQVWQETEVISTTYPDFEAVYFEKELEQGRIYVSSEYEFFPLYILCLTTQFGSPTVAKEGVLPVNDLINIDEGSDVLLYGFCNPGSEAKLEAALPKLEEVREIGMEYTQILAEDYLRDIL